MFIVNKIYSEVTQMTASINISLISQFGERGKLVSRCDENRQKNRKTEKMRKCKVKHEWAGVESSWSVSLQ